MKEQRTVKIGPGVDLRATIEDGQLKYLEVVAKKTQLKPDEVVQLSEWLQVILGRTFVDVTANVGNLKSLNDRIDEDLYDGGAIPLEERTAGSTVGLPKGEDLKIVDMSDKLVEKTVVKFTTGG